MNRLSSSPPYSRLVFATIALVPFVIAPASTARGAEPIGFERLEREYRDEVRPLLTTFCLTCHSTEKQEGELDLEHLQTLADLRRQPKVWAKVIEQLDQGEMPPTDAKQPTAEQRGRLREWASGFLDSEARARAGDPGRVVLRRLSNVEFDRTVEDLTGVDLRPAREFPGDGAAGEGFTNTGEALVMSPALLEKYLQAAKQIADHAVLLPDGLRFSPSTTRRDWTNELVQEIRALYGVYTDPAGLRRVILQGLDIQAEAGGRIPLEAYFTALVTHRAALEAGSRTVASVADEYHLSPKYLQRLWDTGRGTDASPLLNVLRTKWRTANPAQIPALVAEIQPWQAALTKFNNVGHFKNWQEPINPMAESTAIRRKLVVPAGSQEVVARFVTRNAGDGVTGDWVEWRQPRLEGGGRPPILLRDLRGGWAGLLAKQRSLREIARYLDAVDGARTQTKVDVAALARDRHLDEEVLRAWFDFLGVSLGEVKIETLFTERVSNSGGYAFVRGWGPGETPNAIANSSDQQVRVPGIMKPHSVAVHPSPTRNVAVGWRSPIAGQVTIAARVQHAHPECGNGVTWSIQWRRGNERRQLAGGEIERAGAANIEPLRDVAIQPGDLLSLLIGPRAKEHSCDLTEVELVVSEQGGSGRKWPLSAEVAGRIEQGNPLADLSGNPDVWYLYHEPLERSTSLAGIPRGSLLDQWRDATDATRRRELADALQRLMIQGPPADAAHPDAQLDRQLRSPNGPLWSQLDFTQLASGMPASAVDVSAVDDTAASTIGLPPASFGAKFPSGRAAEAGSLVSQAALSAPVLVEVRIPAALAVDRELVVEAVLDRETGAEGSVQCDVVVDPVPTGGDLLRGDLVPGLPVLVMNDGSAKARFDRAWNDFREVFPAAVCYTKIVPVDEVVTLVQLHRDDERLSRLMLDDAAHRRLEALWDELRYVSQDAFKVQEAYGQFMEYVTQDGDVRIFEPLRKPIQERAAALQQRLLDTEPKHLAALLDLASEAYRRPLTGDEQTGLRELYSSLRRQELDHEAAIRLTLARILVSPAFLYRVEQPAAGSKAEPVSDWELASRLSYFLWSAPPDDELRRVAATGELRNPEVLVHQAKRMLRSDKVRALATEFACQWLDIRGFDQLNEKNEQLFPEFPELRDDMYEESVRFFVDLFQRNGSVLEILDSDHTFLNADLAKFYGMPFPSEAGPGDWRRIEGLKQAGRGGILGMATTLAKHSGASRTSPILRGNWVSEFLLGEKLPKPPKNVPLLPEAENATEMTVRQLVEKHREVAACAKCHDRIDPLGFALEGFDTVGRARTKDLAGRPIDTQVAFRDGVEFAGLPGLRNYLTVTRRDPFVKQFCRKLLGYSLGRGLQISDQPLLEEMQARLRADEFRFETVLEVLLRSQQFRYQRGLEATRDDS